MCCAVCATAVLGFVDRSVYGEIIVMLFPRTGQCKIRTALFVKIRIFKKSLKENLTVEEFEGKSQRI